MEGVQCTALLNGSPHFPFGTRCNNNKIEKFAFSLVSSPIAKRVLIRFFGRRRLDRWRYVAIKFYWIVQAAAAATSLSSRVGFVSLSRTELFWVRFSSFVRGIQTEQWVQVKAKKRNGSVINWHNTSELAQQRHSSEARRLF